MGGVRSGLGAGAWSLGFGVAVLSLGCGRTAKDGSAEPPTGAAGVTGVAGAATQPFLTPNCAVSLAGNDGRHCAVYQDGSVWCWGADSDSGGPSNFEHGYEPRRVEGLTGVSRLVVGLRHSCAIADGSLLCWGDNESGQIDDSGEAALPPTSPGLPLSFEPAAIKGFSLGETQTCAVDALSHLSCRGTDVSEQARGPAQIPFAGPQDTTMPGADDYVIDDRGVVFGLADWQGASAMPSLGQNNAWYSGAGSPSCVLKRTGSLWCTRTDPTAQDQRLFAVARLGERVSQAGTGKEFFCALSDGKVWCEGLNSKGQTGVSDEQIYASGHFVEGLTDVRWLSVADYSACALKGDGSVWCWGDISHERHIARPTAPMAPTSSTASSSS